jgi:hypothetical protein
MLRYILAIGPLLISTMALGEGKDASYYCTEQLAAGLAFDLQMKQWKDAFLSPKQEFVLRTQYLGDKQIDLIKGGYSVTVQRYSVTITRQGSNNGQKCVGWHWDAANGEVNVEAKEDIECWTSFGLYRFNLVNNRFLNFYPYGYIEGDDDGKDTPSVEAGTCTLIQ